MKSVSGKDWEEEKFNKRLTNKIKIENNFSELIARQIVTKNFNGEELYSINNNLELKNPFNKKKDFLKGVYLLDNSIQNNEHIYIIGDYDVDGCTSTSLIVKFLKSINASYSYYIPNRFKDGYGSSLNLIKKIIQKRPSLIIMLDNGSNSNQAINFLNKKNIKSIIIDHHEIYNPYPKSNILINPKKKCEYSDFKYLCSATLTYFFIDLYLKEKKLNINFSKNLFLVLMATISDVMPLRKINRLIAKKVLLNINIEKNYFFKKIFEFKKIKKPIQISDFSFLFGPIINSAGRLDDPNIIVKLFTSNKSKDIDLIINKLILLNEKRKLIENSILEKINFKKIKLDLNSVIILENSNISEGLIGIIASKIKTYFNKPSIVITKSANLYKGSARSTENFNIGKLIKRTLDLKLIENGGGHNMAAGFTIKKENIKSFKKFIYESTNHKILSTKSEYFSKISFTSLNKFLISDLNKLEPYGEGNLSPLFLIENIKVFKTKILKKNLISCYLKNRFGKILPAVSFNIFESDISKHLISNKNELNMIVQLGENFWNNKKNLQILIIDILTTPNKA
tara:strand:+ start:1079 stop:2782 length:1704 start_codon:yes stop_codon:yes gene_type:complete